jgi:hypothetical protein
MFCIKEFSILSVDPLKSIIEDIVKSMNETLVSVIYDYAAAYIKFL